MKKREWKMVVDSLKDFGQDIPKDREDCNHKVLTILSKFVSMHPDIRFGQMLTILSLNGDLFYEESRDTLAKLEKVWADRNKDKQGSF
jgi:hypothetical protein